MEKAMKILVTGSSGFIGKNLISQLINLGYQDIFSYDIDTDRDCLNRFAAKCDFVFHLAGVNRPETNDEFMRGNAVFTQELLNILEQNSNKAPVLVASSTQAAFENPYGESKKAGENIVFAYAEKTGTPVYIYRLTNVFGKWCRPNYNSAVATFCHNTARNLPLTINDPEAILNLVYIDDVVNEFVRALNSNATRLGDYCTVEPVYMTKLGQIAKLLESFRKSRENLSVPDSSDDFTKKLYSTYLSYLPNDLFSYPLKIHVDARGSFTEFIRTSAWGQLSVNISKPSITKGNHWHHTKTEKFLVVSGEGIIRFRALGGDEIIEYSVNGYELSAVDIPPGYVHSIVNTGNCDMVTIMWANECFDPENMDTYSVEI